jgi:hypothetical protein
LWLTGNEEGFFVSSRDSAMCEKGALNEAAREGRKSYTKTGPILCLQFTPSASSTLNCRPA